MAAHWSAVLPTKHGILSCSRLHFIAILKLLNLGERVLGLGKPMTSLQQEMLPSCLWPGVLGLTNSALDEAIVRVEVGGG